MIQITVSKSILSRCLDIVERALPARTTIPALNNIYFECVEGELFFLATNLEMGIKIKIPHQNGSHCKVLFPSKIVNIVRHLPDEDVNIFLNQDNHCVKLVCGQSTFDLFGANPEDYPVIDTDLTMEQSITVGQVLLKEALKTSVFAASTDESRPAFNGLLFHFYHNHIKLTASDTYRLVIKDIQDVEWTFQEKRSLIPAKSLRELLKIIGDGGTVSIIPGNRQTIFNFNDIIFTTRVLDEKYPDVSVVIPDRYQTRLTLKKNIFEDTVARASLLAEGVNQLIHFSISDRGLTIKVSSKIGRMEETVGGRFEGEENDVYVNSKFVLDVLRLIVEEEIQIDFHGKNGPLVFTVPGNKTYLYLMLPIKIE